MVLAHLGHVDGLALVGRARHSMAVERLHALGVHQGGGEPAGDIVGDVLAPDLDQVGIDHVAFEEDGDGGGAATHVDHGDPQFHLVVHQAGQARGVGRHHEFLHVQVTALDAGGQVLDRTAARGDDMNVDAQAIAAHAAWVADAAAAVNGVTDRDRVDQLAAVGQGTVQVVAVAPLAQDLT